MVASKATMVASKAAMVASKAAMATSMIAAMVATMAATVATATANVATATANVASYKVHTARKIRDATVAGWERRRHKNLLISYINGKFPNDLLSKFDSDESKKDCVVMCYLYTADENIGHIVECIINYLLTEVLDEKQTDLQTYVDVDNEFDDEDQNKMIVMIHKSVDYRRLKRLIEYYTKYLNLRVHIMISVGSVEEMYYTLFC